MIAGTAVAVERALLIRDPGAYHRLHRLPHYRSLAVTAVLAYCAFLTGPPLVGWNEYRLDGYLTSCCFDFISTE